MAASTKIYILGMIAIFAFTTQRMAFVHFAKRCFVNRAYVGGITAAYQMKAMPRVTTSHEDMQPLIDHVNNNNNNIIPKNSDADGPEEVVFGTNKDDNSDLAKSICGPGMIQNSRRLRRDHRYEVMSISEAEAVNRLVKLDFIFNLTVILVVYLAAFGILLSAKRSYENERSEVP